ncbi:hypothetical protein F2Q68_00019475 [Brassica cretica]|uniref:Uncharacterized protein n=1 Tax=Brassica cretica TaxID=69181 RepID=A0A8S9FTU3_BRACR|nr:hypothetical protein F2Q68_00019475 [Brassica cretica]
MSVAELVQQPGRDHLPYLTPFNRSGNGISAWINRMMYSALDKGHPTFTDFPTEKQHLWFRQFALFFAIISGKGNPHNHVFTLTPTVTADATTMIEFPFQFAKGLIF